MASLSASIYQYVVDKAHANYKRAGIPLISLKYEIFRADILNRENIVKLSYEIMIIMPLHWALADKLSPACMRLVRDERQYRGSQEIHALYLFGKYTPLR